jgi:hypothetical protein
MNANTKSETQQVEQNSRENFEDSGFHYSSFLKITDPETGQVLVQQRAD